MTEPSKRPGRGVSRRLIPLGIGLAAAAAAFVLQASGLLNDVEHVAADLWMRARGERPADPRVALCVIDPQSVDALGQWPWPRTRVAELIDRLADAGARVIALDVVFAEPSRSDGVVDLSSEDEALAAAVERAGNVVLGFYFRGEAPAEGGRRFRGDPANIEPAAIPQVFNDPPCGFTVPWRPAVEPNIDRLAAVAASQGFFSNERRPSGKMRTYGLVIGHGARACPGSADCPAERFCGEHGYYPALALAAVARFTGGEIALSRAGARVPLLSLADRPVETDHEGSLTINYRGRRDRYPRLPVVEVLAGRVEAEAMSGKLVFVGATETGIGDFQVTPFNSEIPGVEVHAHVADNLLNGDYIEEGLPQLSLSLLALFALGPLVALLVSSARRYLTASLAAIGVVAAWPVVCYAAFYSGGWHLQTVSPMVAGLAALVATLRYQIGFVDREKRQIRHVLGQYVSKSIVEEMLADPERVKLGGEKRELTVLFSDIRGFTDLSERLDPVAITRLLNRYFTPMTRLVLAAGGTFDKYMGDALMAFFGAPVVQPDHASRACRAALDMRDELARLNASWRASGVLPEGQSLGIGIGLATGEVAVGNMGSEDVFDYTVIGDTVNLGSRIEGLNKLYGTSILVAEATARAVGAAFLLREVDRVRVKGKKVPVVLYELVSEAPGAAGTAERLARFGAALAAFRGREFERSEALFAAILAEVGADTLSELYLERSRHLRHEPPPADWDGVVTMKSK